MTRAHERRSTWSNVREGAVILLPFAAAIATVIALKPRGDDMPAPRPARHPHAAADTPSDIADADHAPAAPVLARPASTMPASYSLPPLLIQHRAPTATAAAGVKRAVANAVPARASTAVLLGIAMALWFAAAYLWQYRLGGQFWPSFRGTYAAGPYLWTICAAVAYSAWRSAPRGEHEVDIIPLAFVVGAFSVAATILTGVVTGMGHSPYAREPYWLLTNTFYIGAPLVAFEFARAYVIRMLGGRVTLAVALTAVVATLLGFSYRRFTEWDGAQPELMFFSSQFLPDLASNLLASFLVYLGGPFAGIVYRGVGEMYEWYSPILADLPWLTASFVGVATPAVGLWVLEGLSAPSEQSVPDDGIRLRAPSTAWVLTATASLAILWFTFGFFGVKPSFIPSHSMEPAIDPGSIVFTRDINPDDVRAGDVVLYQRGRAHVLHRVVEKRPDGTFIFKGDHNNTPDPEPVRPAQIEGRMIARVPYVGWVPIWASRAIQKFSGQ